MVPLFDLIEKKEEIMRKNCVAACVVASVLAFCHVEADPIDVGIMGVSKLQRAAADSGKCETFLKDLKAVNNRAHGKTVDEIVEFARSHPETGAALTQLLKNEGLVTSVDPVKSQAFGEIIRRFVGDPTVRTEDALPPAPPPPADDGDTRPAEPMAEEAAAQKKVLSHDERGRFMRELEGYSVGKSSRLQAEIKKLVGLVGASGDASKGGIERNLANAGIIRKEADEIKKILDKYFQ
jgi:hypothetical protein